MDTMECAWDEGLSGACEFGDMEIIQLMMSKGMTNKYGCYWDYGHGGACRGGNWDLLQFMLSKEQPDRIDWCWGRLQTEIGIKNYLEHECIDDDNELFYNNKYNKIKQLMIDNHGAIID